MQTKIIFGLAILAAAVIVFSMTYVGSPKTPALDGGAGGHSINPPGLSPGSSGGGAYARGLNRNAAESGPRASNDDLDAGNSFPEDLTPVARQAQPAPIVKASAPLALTDPDPGMDLSEMQLEVMEELREQFMAEVGAGNQDPNDPQYLARWTEAQRECDDQLRVFIGLRAFTQLKNKSDGEATEVDTAGQVTVK